MKSKRPCEPRASTLVVRSWWLVCPTLIWACLADTLGAAAVSKEKLGLPPSATFPGAGLLNANPPFLVGVKASRADLIYREGDKLAAEFTAERQAYLYVIYHQADGKSLLLFPNEARRENRILAGQPVLIPKPGEGLRFRIRPPLGSEVLQVLAALKPIAELDALVQKTGRLPAVPGELLDKLRDRLGKDPSSWTEHRVSIRTLAREAPAEVRPPARVGLFIGVDKYQDAKRSEPLEQIRRSAEQMAKTLGERGKLDPARTKLILGEAATRANIEAAILRWLPSVTQPGDTVFLYYMGHGNTVKSLDPSKPGGLDGLLAVYDNDLGRTDSAEEFGARARGKFITDDALARWLQELSGRQIVLMVEACHSGSMVDIRALGRFFARQAAVTKGISQLNTVVITGCGPEENVSMLKTEVTSHMARYLTEAARDLPSPVTVQQAFEYYRRRVRSWGETHRDVGPQDPIMIDTALVPIVLAP